MPELAKAESQTLARPLSVLVPLIQDDLKQAERAGIPYYRAAGDKLLEAESTRTLNGNKISKAEFISWTKSNFGISHRQARQYMELAKRLARESGARPTFTSLRDFDRRTGGKSGTGKPTWQAPVQQIINRVDTETLNLKREEMKRADEREAQRTLALQLIDIGYKVLARKLHPDRGGSRDAMA